MMKESPTRRDAFPLKQNSVHCLWSIVRSWGRFSHPKIPAFTKSLSMLSISYITTSIDKIPDFA